MTSSVNKGPQEKKKAKNQCKCGRKALYRRPRGGLAARKDHPLCRQCYESLRDSERIDKP